MAILAVPVAVTCKGLLGFDDSAGGTSLGLLLPVDFVRAVESSSSERSALQSHSMYGMLKQYQLQSALPIFLFVLILWQEKDSLVAQQCQT